MKSLSLRYLKRIDSQRKPPKGVSILFLIWGESQSWSSSLEKSWSCSPSLKKSAILSRRSQKLMTWLKMMKALLILRPKFEITFV